MGRRANHEKWYSIQHGSDTDCSNGFTVKREAIAAAKRMCKDDRYSGEEIRVCVTEGDSDYCLEEIIIRSGSRI